MSVMDFTRGSLTFEMPGPARWVFPQDRFVEYEKKDEGWCSFFGIGHRIEPTFKLHCPNVRMARIEPREEYIEEDPRYSPFKKFIAGRRYLAMYFEADSVTIEDLGKAP